LAMTSFGWQSATDVWHMPWDDKEFYLSIPKV